jgi:hypothetical protein
VDGKDDVFGKIVGYAFSVSLGLLRGTNKTAIMHYIRSRNVVSVWRPKTAVSVSGCGLVSRGFRHLHESVTKLIIKRNPVNTFCIEI